MKEKLKHRVNRSVDNFTFLRGTSMKVEEKGNDLVITLPMNREGVLSAKGKTYLFATSHGNMPTSIIKDDLPLVVGVNAYIKNLKYVKPT